MKDVDELPRFKSKKSTKKSEKKSHSRIKIVDENIVNEEKLSD